MLRDTDLLGVATGFSKPLHFSNQRMVLDLICWRKADSIYYRKLRSKMRIRLRERLKSSSLNDASTSDARAACSS